MIHLEKNNLSEIVKEGLHLVDFYAEWCGPCKMMSSELEAIDENINIIKVNIDEFEDLAREYRIMSVPTIIIFKDGKKEEELIGYHTSNDLKEIIERIK